MDAADRQRRVEEVCLGALSVEASARDGFIAAACGDDAALRDEVDALLRHASAADGFLSTPMVSALTLPASAATLAPGQQCGPYRIVARLGAGGMGEVYRARDVGLGRDVAIKVLPAASTSDPERLRRFEREARLLATLNHPHVGAIYGALQVGSIHCLVLELVDGETLAARIARGRIPVDEALAIACQIAAALQAAHEKGIVHRDLKPANVKLNGTTVKVLDFGLAKASGDANLSESPTVASAETAAGVLLGTAAYMSPEQARGKPVDKRADIWAFGAVLYEMLTGRPAFRGDTLADVLTAILTGDPDWGALPVTLPDSVRQLLRRCLQKDSGRRLHDIADARLEIEDALRAPAVAPRVSAPLHVRRSARVVSAAVALVLLLAGAAAWRFWPARSPAARPPGSASFVQITRGSTPELFPSLSPDGRTVVFSRSGDVWSQLIGGRNAVNLTNSANFANEQPALSPDGSHIAFRSSRQGGGIFVMGATGESVRRVADFGFNPSWSPDGRRIVVSTERTEFDPGARLPPTPTMGQLWVIDIWSGARRRLGDVDGVQPQWSPHDKRIAYWSNVKDGVVRGQRDIWTIDVDGRGAVAVTDDLPLDWSPAWSPDGRFLYFSSTRSGSMNIWRVAIDEATGRTLAGPEPLTGGGTVLRGHATVSRDGRRLVYVERLNISNVLVTGFDAAAEKIVGSAVPVTEGTRNVTYGGPAVSRDGEWLAFTAVEGREFLTIVRSDGRDAIQVTDDDFLNRFPSWSPDGRRLAFVSTRTGRYQIHAVNRDGLGLEQLTKLDKTPEFPVWSPDGRTILYHSVGNTYTIDVAGPLDTRTPVRLPPIDDGSTDMIMAQWSPDGRRLVGGLRRNNATVVGLGVYSFASRTYDTIEGPWRNAIWLNDSRRVLAVDENARALVVIDTATKRWHAVSPPAWTTGPPALSIDGQNRRIYYVTRLTSANLWMMDLE